MADKLAEAIVRGMASELDTEIIRDAGFWFDPTIDAWVNDETNLTATVEQINSWHREVTVMNERLTGNVGLEQVEDDSVRVLEESVTAQVRPERSPTPRHLERVENDPVHAGCDHRSVGGTLVYHRGGSGSYGEGPGETRSCTNCGRREECYCPDPLGAPHYVQWRAVQEATGVATQERSGRAPTPRHLERVRQRLVTLRQTVDDSYIEMGQLLQEVRESRYFERWGFETFEAYAESELGMRRRKAYYLMSISEAFVRLAISPEERQGITLSNARELAAATRNPATGQARELVGEERVRLLEQARTMPSRDLRNSIRREQGLPTTEFVTFSCAVMADQKLVIETALEVIRRRAEAQPDELSRGRLVELMAAEILAGDAGYVIVPNAAVNNPESLEQLGMQLSDVLRKIEELDPGCESVQGVLRRYVRSDNRVSTSEEGIHDLPGLWGDHD